MADVSVKMGVSGIAQFKQAMTEATSSVKMVDAALKLNEQQLKATGDKETYLQNKIVALKTQIEAQTKVVNNAKAAMDTLVKNGADPMSKAVTDMQTKYYNANAALIEMTESLKALETGSQGAAEGVEQAANSADKLTNSVNGINKRISLDNVISGINSITDGLEAAGKKAIDVGEQIWQTIVNSAKWGDDTATLATMYGIDAETLQRMQAASISIDTSVESIIKSRQKLESNMVNGSDAVQNSFKQLGVTVSYLVGKEGEISVFRDTTDVFWETGEALMNLTNEAEKDAMAQQIFGQSWRNLLPLFTAGRTAYEEALEGADVVTNENVDDLAALNDQMADVQQKFAVLKNTVLAEVAPAFTELAGVVSDLLHEFNEYLKTDEGQAMLDQLGEAVKSLFGDLASIDPEQAMQNFTSVFTGLTDGLKWLTSNSGGVIDAMKAIVAGWAALKLTGGALQIYQLIHGITGLFGAGAQTAAATSGAAAGSAWGGGFASAVMKAAPWLLGIYTLLNPAGTASNDLDVLWDENGNPTRAALESGLDWTADEDLDKGERKRTTSWQDQPDWVKENQMENETAWVAMPQEQMDAVQDFWDFFRTWNGEDSPDFDQAWENYEKAFEGQEELFDAVDELMNLYAQRYSESDGSNIWPDDLPEDFFKTAVEPELADNAESVLQGELDGMDLSTVVTVKPVWGGYGVMTPSTHANGLEYVPFDGYPALLHKGERVQTAREVSAESRSYNSNLYVESMYMNNGQDAEGLAAAMAAANRRTLSGYGS